MSLHDQWVTRTGPKKPLTCEWCGSTNLVWEPCAEGCCDVLVCANCGGDAEVHVGVPHGCCEDTARWRPDEPLGDDGEQS